MGNNFMAKMFKKFSSRCTLGLFSRSYSRDGLDWTGCPYPDAMCDADLTDRSQVAPDWQPQSHI